jgi:hypothetical protein
MRITITQDMLKEAEVTLLYGDYLLFIILFLISLSILAAIGYAYIYAKDYLESHEKVV